MQHFVDVVVVVVNVAVEDEGRKRPAGLQVEIGISLESVQKCLRDLVAKVVTVKKYTEGRLGRRN